MLRLSILLKNAFWRSVCFRARSGVGPINDRTIGVKMNAFAEPKMRMPIHSLKKTMKKYEFYYMPTITIAISNAIHP